MMVRVLRDIMIDIIRIHNNDIDKRLASKVLSLLDGQPEYVFVDKLGKLTLTFNNIIDKYPSSEVTSWLKRAAQMEKGVDLNESVFL